VQTPQNSEDAEDPRLVAGRRLLGRRLRDARAQAGLHLSDVAIATGLTPQYLSHLERGRRLPTLPALLSIADGYGVLVTDLLRGLYPFDSRESPAELPEPPPDGRFTRGTD
jgi:transcriptional regulator with XRE-family HTH domain